MWWPQQPEQKRQICQQPPCAGRLAAMVRGEFIYNYELPRGWIFVEDARREWLGKAKWDEAMRRGNADRTDEPFVWLCCPFCGADLPEPPFGGLLTP